MTMPTRGVIFFSDVHFTVWNYPSPVTCAPKSISYRGRNRHNSLRFVGGMRAPAWRIRCLWFGIMLRMSGSPPLAIKQEECDLVIGNLDKALPEV